MSFDFNVLQWIEAKDNPFEMRCLDIRDYCWNAQSLTNDPLIAQKFVELRSSTGEQLRGQSPDNFVKLACQLKYDSKRRVFDEMAKGPILMAEVMEDKWDIFLYDSFLYFVRSWGGELIYKAQVNISTETTIIEGVEVESRLVEDGEEEVLCDVDFLVKSHLYNLPVPHRIQKGISESDKQLITISSFTSFGRWASFATYEDTTRLQI
jgi:hypothetical protein